MKQFFAALLCACTLLGYGQTDISGTWAGVLDQKHNEFSEDYKLVLRITQNGEQITGTSYIETKGIYAEMTFEGTYRNKTISFQEREIIRENISDDLSWCIKKANLWMEIDNGVILLSGPWQGKAGFVPCHSGNISLRKVDTRA